MKARYIAFIAIFCLGFALQNDPFNAVELGERLFKDPILSADSTISCASCHRPEFAFADTARLSKGVGGKLGERNTPSVMNMAARPYFFYDGRAATLEEQVFHPIRNPFEMNLAVQKAVERVRNDKNYRRWFKKIYNQKPDSITIGRAIATFMRSLESVGDAPYDLWINGKDTAQMMSESAIRGRFLFINKAKCFDCHFTPDFTGDEFRNIGLYDGKMNNDVGRFAITKDSNDMGKMKVPGLRNVGRTAPFMHDGRFKSLKEVVDFYDNPLNFVPNPINADILVQKPLGLTETEKKDLIAFLHTLTDAKFQKKKAVK
jgi:cytochrome c peroxidase